MKPFSGIEPHVSLPVVIAGSIVGNMLLWFGLGQGSNQPVHIPSPPELIFDRVTVEKQPNVEKPIFHPILPKPRPPKVEPKKEILKPTPVKTPPPQGAHNRIVTAKTPVQAPHDDHFVVPSGGNAALGHPTDGQQAGNGTVNPPTTPPVQPPTTTPPPTTPPTQPPVVTPPAGPPVIPKHEDPPPVTPPAAPPAKPKGISREAQPDHQENVEIPERLKTQSFKSFVRVRVNISADGKFTVTLRTSSGNEDVDKLVVDTLNKWTWKPALKDGDPVDSVQQFRFNFSIE